ncbi:hypothetical protein TSTA_002780 [Talaromyces stipitatus ATCC 10500]|uniref:Tf2-1-like SH3-like domain-containing protein n=1 Tax=Talaromyces stipitatus (strain ATCC 10500 / CBS 375.48 / QM 6759 / NRRL 1006) TaxID=441959 RepID=B8MS36_TALSN|nr:uncharacterized protein TSTA_002780 [Talaromyces stipitatus ATCC 10500]EED12214.1 hypothetical protein TSTA_002780 [Talaromyces stipitatus ATCC 10500]
MAPLWATEICGSYAVPSTKATNGYILHQAMKYLFIFREATKIPVDKNSKLSPKLRQQFAGPYTVLRRVRRLAYEFDLPQHWKIHPVFSVAHLEICPPECRRRPRPEEVAVDMKRNGKRSDYIIFTNLNDSTFNHDCAIIQSEADSCRFLYPRYPLHFMYHPAHRPVRTKQHQHHQGTEIDTKNPITLSLDKHCAFDSYYIRTLHPGP